MKSKLERLDCHRCLANDVPRGHFKIDYYSVEVVVEGGKKEEWSYNATKAYTIAQLQCSIMEIPDQLARDLIFTNMSETFCGRHVEHVDRTRPALIAEKDGKYLLLDGTHRMFARIKHGEKPIAYIITEEQLDHCRMT